MHELLHIHISEANARLLKFRATLADILPHDRLRRIHISESTVDTYAQFDRSTGMTEYAACINKPIFSDDLLTILSKTAPVAYASKSGILDDWVYMIPN